MPKKPSKYTADLSKFVHGGQAMGQLDSGQKVFVWGALPGETIEFLATKAKKDFIEGVAQKVIASSPERVQPRDQLYLSTSPWQILSEKTEDVHKAEILEETFQRGGIELAKKIKVWPTTEFWCYRNKMEYSFYGDDDGLHLALYNRGTHAKQIVSGSSIARPEIDKAASKIKTVLGQKNVRAGVLKTLILRCSQDGEVVAALFVKDEKFIKIKELDSLCKGLVVVYSNPKSPASVRTKDLYQFGDVSLQDSIAGHKVSYDVFSFFQVNVPVFERATGSIIKMIGKLPAVDMYSGVGSIGIAVPSVSTLVEVDDSNIAWTRKNASRRAGLEVVHISSEKTLDLIKNNTALIVDPPRAGLHTDLIEKINQIKPPRVVYLSCNPSTQVRDIAALSLHYRVEKLEMFNFFPRTPHIESLALLVRQ